MKPLVKLIFKLLFSLMVLLFINNPIEPLSIFIKYQGQTQWYPLLQAESVVHYQQQFTLLVLVSITLAILEYLFRSQIWEVVEDIPSIIGLMIIRAIPQEAFNFGQEFLGKFYSVSHVIINILLLLAAVGIVLKIFNFIAKQREGGILKDHMEVALPLFSKIRDSFHLNVSISSGRGKSVKLIFKLVLSIMLLLFINNPIEPLSFFMKYQGQTQWYPLLQAESVVHYQQIFTFLALVGIAIAILEYLYQSLIWEVIEDIPNIIGLLVIRAIPIEAINFSQKLLEKYHPVFYVIISIFLLLAGVGMVLKIFNFVALQRNGATKPK